MTAMDQIEQVDAANWEEWLAANEGKLLDIREAEEWEQGTLPGAILIPMTEITERLDEVPKDAPLLCICRSGGRSQRVAEFLAHHGYEVANMAGGMHDLGMQD